MTAFDVSPVLESPTLRLRPLTGADREPLFAAANDPEIWAQHPSKDRYQRPVFDPYFDFLLRSGGALAAIEAESGVVIGCSRFYAVPDHPGEVGIGFTFLARPYWGGRWNREMKRLMLRHAFSRLPRVWFHIGPDNLRSQIATTRLGAVFAYDAELAISQKPALMKCYWLTQAGWDAAEAGQSRAQ